MKLSNCPSDSKASDVVVSLHQFEEIINRLSAGSRVGEYSTPGTYGRFSREYKQGGDIASDLAWEMYMLCKAGEWDLAEGLLRALVADSRGEQLPPTALLP